MNSSVVTVSVSTAKPAEEDRFVTEEPGDDAFRIERDTMGEMRLPREALYAAQTQRAVENFPISGEPLPPRLIHAIGLVKLAAARVNRDLGLLDPETAGAVEAAAA